MGDNQLGVEVMGHSFNDRTRYSAALLSTVDGTPGLPYGSNAYSGYFTASQAFDTGKAGVQRIGGYAFVGLAPTTWLTQTGPSGSTVIPGSGIGNKSFSREGIVGQFYFGQHVDLTVVTQHGSDSAWFGQGYGDFVDNPGGICLNGNAPPDNTQPCNNTHGTTLAAGSRNPTWNGVLFEPHYVYSPQLIFIGRYETIRMSQQSTPGTPSNFGNITSYTVGYRYNPIMTSRAGLAWHTEYNWFHQDSTSPVSAPTLPSSELLLGLDFDF